MFPNRTKLPTCEYGVPAPTEEGIDSCGEPAVALWDWGESGTMYVCKEHDCVVAGEEEEGIS